jgi:hypothetical protein
LIKYSKIKYITFKNFYFISLNFQNFFFKKLKKKMFKLKYIQKSNNINILKKINKIKKKNYFFKNIFINTKNNKIKNFNFCKNISTIFLLNLNKIVNKKKFSKYVFFKKKVLNILLVTFLNQKLKYLKHKHFILILKNLIKNEILKPNEINNEVLLGRNPIIRFLKKKFKRNLN